MRLWLATMVCGIAAAQQTAHQHPAAPVPLQPLAQQVRQLEEALSYLGQPLPVAEQRRINEAIANPDEAAAVRSLALLVKPTGKLPPLRQPPLTSRPSFSLVP